MAFLPALSPILGYVGAGASALGSITGGYARGAASSYQSQVAENNRIAMEQLAEHSVQAGQARASNTSMKGAALAGKIKTAQAASGLDVNVGSPVNVQASQAALSKLDTETVLSNAELEAYGYRTKAAAYGAERDLYKAASEYAPISGWFGAAGSLMSNAKSLGFKWFGGEDKIDQSSPLSLDPTDYAY